MFLKEVVLFPPDMPNILSIAEELSFYDSELWSESYSYFVGVAGLGSAILRGGFGLHSPPAPMRLRMARTNLL